MSGREGSQRGRWLIITLVVLLVAAAATIGVLVGRGGSSAGASVTLEPAGATGADPFTASVAVGPVPDFPANVRAITTATRKTLPTDPKTHTLAAAGTTPGLYGGSGDTHVCDGQQLVAFLGENPGKAAAWASVLGIAPANIAQYVATLTPVVLTSDTLVTNHGYRNGAATTLQSVLQAGTAVMVDGTGTPRVKCNCGNPLTPPEPIRFSNARVEAWPGYTPTEVTVVNAGNTTVNLTVINITTGDTYTTPTGSGTSGGEWVAAGIGDQQGQTTISTSHDGATWTTAAVLPGPVQGLAWGNGQWLALSANQTSAGTSVLESTDLHTWNQVATAPDYLTDMAYGNGRWIAVGRMALTSTGIESEFPPAVVYASADGRGWSRAAAIADAPPFTSVAYGDGTWIAVGNGIHQYGETSMTYRSTDGTHWTRQNDTGLNSQTDSRIAFGSGQWALGGQALSPTGSQGVYPDGVVSVSTDTTTWTSDPGAQFVHNKIAGVAYGNGQWLAVAQDGDHPVGYHRNPSSAFFASSDAKTWTRRGHLDPEGWDLAFGGGPTASGPTAPPTAAPASTTTTTQSASGLASIDFRNYSYEDQVCGTHKLVHLANGSWRQDPTNTSNYCGMSINSVAFADVTGDGVADAIVSGSGSAGGTALGLVTWTTVFAGSPTGPANLGYFSGLAYPPYSTSQGITLWSQRLGPNDPACCPSSYQKTTYKYSNSTAKFTATGSTIVPASQLPKG